MGLEKVSGLKEARKERNSIPWVEYELEKVRKGRRRPKAV